MRSTWSLRNIPNRHSRVRSQDLTYSNWKAGSKSDRKAHHPWCYKDYEVPGTVEVNGNRLTVKSKFIVKLLDYNIKVPQIVWQNIAQQVEVTIDFVYRPL